MTKHNPLVDSQVVHSWTKDATYQELLYSVMFKQMGQSDELQDALIMELQSREKSEEYHQKMLDSIGFICPFTYDRLMEWEFSTGLTA